MVSRFMLNVMKLEDLAQRAGISARTVRYYVQRGLVPPPAFRGKDSSYDESHLLRLQVIKKLQAAFYPLETIKALVAGKDDVAMRALLSAAPSPPPVAATHDVHPHVARAQPEAWRKFVLSSGVELLVREGTEKDARVRRVLAMFEEEEES